jgi:hypothetical protein
MSISYLIAILSRILSPVIYYLFFLIYVIFYMLEIIPDSQLEFLKYLLPTIAGNLITLAFYPGTLYTIGIIN